MYVYGDTLAPEHLTEVMGVAPTKAWRKGQRKPSQRPDSTAVAKTGLWMLRSTTPSTDVKDHVQELLEKLKLGPDMSVLNIAGVDDAKLDIYLLCEEKRECCVELTVSQIAALGAYGFRIACTFGYLFLPSDEA